MIAGFDSLMSLYEKFWGLVDREGGRDSRWSWLGKTNPNGYGWFCYKGDTYSAHRTSYRLAHGKISKETYILHSCDNRKCVNPAHLRQGTHRENVDDMIAKGRQLFGEKNPAVRLSETEVLLIRDLIATTTQIALSKQFKVHKSTISLIITRKKWKHI